MRVLAVNAGSSSLKLSVLDGDRRVDGQELPSAGARIDPDEVAAAVTRLGAVDAVGHRIVHGGARYREAVRVDPGVLAALKELCALAPLHQAKSLAALAAVTDVLRDVPAVACFDTAFHATLPAAAYTYALPAAWRERWGLRRYGFHGLAHASAARAAGKLLGRSLEGLRIVTCHLGAGASLAAVRDGRSVDTTMGFTPLDGLVMATRSGSVDPGLVLWLLEHTGLREPEMAAALEHESGLLALAGTGDMRAVLGAAEHGDPQATLALAVYVHRLVAGIAAMAAAMGGLDALVFCGGVGEHAPAVRSAAAARLAFLGVGVDRVANDEGAGDRDVTAGASGVRTLVVAAREDVEIARQVHGVLREQSHEPPPVVVRPVQPADLDALDALLSALDGPSRYRRWFSAATDVHRAAAWAAHPEDEDAVGLVATAVDGGELVGHGAFVPIDATSAEVCFEVAASWRHHGVAGLLLSELERQAARRGLATLVAEVLPENADMLAVLREHGPCREQRDGGVVDVRLAVRASRALPG